MECGYSTDLPVPPITENFSSQTLEDNSSVNTQNRVMTMTHLKLYLKTNLWMWITKNRVTAIPKPVSRILPSVMVSKIMSYN